MNIPIRRWKNLDSETRSRFLSRSELDISDILPGVTKIVEQVKQRGDQALFDLSREIEQCDIEDRGIAVHHSEFDTAETLLDAEVKEWIGKAVTNVRKFHEMQKPRAMEMVEIEPGVMAGERATPIDSVGLYVPRGRGSFPSMVYMLAVPAEIAGVPFRSLTTPPNPDGSVDPGSLYAAKLCGIDRVYRMGGAQAIAALAFGTESVASVNKIIGPGSIWATAAKRLLYGQIDSGLPAGPSESMIFADDSADIETLCLDLLTEAEHGSDSSAILVSTSEKILQQVAEALPGYIGQLPEPRKTFVSDVFGLNGNENYYGALLLGGSETECAEIVNTIAPEHLQIHTREPFDILPLIRNAGEIILGGNTPFSAANYLLGANAVLPTGGHAKTYSGVSVRDFIKYSSVFYTTPRGIKQASKGTAVLAEYETFTAHRNAAEHRLRK